MQLRFGIHQFIYVRNAFRGHWSGLTQLKICHNLFAKNMKEFFYAFSDPAEKWAWYAGGNSQIQHRESGKTSYQTLSEAGL